MVLKKEIILVIIILCLIILYEISTNNISEKYVNSLLNQCEQLYENIGKIKDNDDENLSKIIKEKILNLKKEWFEKQEILALYVEHDELEKVTKNIVALEENIKNREYSLALEYLKEFEFSMKHFNSKDKVVLKNIF